MSAQLHVLTGARAGERITIAADAVLGRDPGLALQFDPERDLDVSARHASIRFEDGRWILRDLDSRNGTFVNNRRVREADLRDGDRVRFGSEGPEVEFRSTDAGGPSETVAAALASKPTSRLERSNRRLRTAVRVMFVALIGVVGYSIWSASMRRSDWEVERERLLDRVDAALDAGDATTRSLTGEREGLAQALREAQAEVRRVRSQLERATGEEPVDTADLRRQLQSAMAALERQQLAASLDFEAIEAVTRRAVAVVWVEAADGTVSTGTAFAVRPDGTMATGRHVLTGGASGPRPRRIAVQFADSRQVWPARILVMSDSADVAIIRAENIVGDVPTVAALNLRADTLGAGTPVAWIGFPLGGETWPQDPTTGRIARPLGAVGVLTSIGTARIAVQGYGAVGASGSPIVDQAGGVLAVLVGATNGGRNRELIAVPAAAVDELLRQIGASGISPR